MEYKITYKAFGEHAVLVEWPSKINEDILFNILNYRERLKEFFKKKNFEFIPSYTSLAVIDLDKKVNPEKLIDQLKEHEDKKIEGVQLRRKLWKLPVCYDLEFAMDLEKLCTEKGLKQDRFVKLHEDQVYTVYCMGFLPGFMYLGGLPEALHSKRLETPRLKVPAGSVGIGGSQTGIYPQQSPGGWNIIGNSPVQLFNVSKKPPCFISVGDRVQFYSISKPEYDILKIKVETGIYTPENSAWND
ncbi:5-oxoprolinase subunit PxpB [Flavobacteriaceae bacterium M23B6Z8]